MGKKQKSSFLVQGTILAAASLICRVIGLLYRRPLTGHHRQRGNGVLRICIQRLQHYSADCIVQYSAGGIQVHCSQACDEGI